MKVYFVVLFMLGFFLVPPGGAMADDIVITVVDRDLKSYERFVAEKGGNPLVITDFDSEHSTRLVVCMVLIEQALRQGGNTDPVRFYAVPNYTRAMREVKCGRATILGQDTWGREFEESVYKTISIIPRGESRRAIYGRRDNSRLMKATQLSDLQPLKALTGQGWVVDIETLEGMGVADVVLAPEYRLHYKMIALGRADFGLLELSEVASLPPELGVAADLAVGLDESRHFMVSKKHPRGKAAYEALQQGLAVLEKKGTIKRAMQECGFLSSTLELWKQIYP